MRIKKAVKAGGIVIKNERNVWLVLIAGKNDEYVRMYRKKKKYTHIFNWRTS